MEGEPDPDAGGGHLLCLVNHSSDDFDEYVEIYPYDDGDKSAGPTRYIASISRLSIVLRDSERTANGCGIASAWFPMNL